VRAQSLRLVVGAYRALAWLTGIGIITVFFIGIPLQIWAHNLFIVKYVGTAHGILYIIYLVVAFAMTRAVGVPLFSPVTVVNWRTIIVLAAGTVPILTFFVERWVSRAYIAPALAAAGRAPREHPVLR
jgi:integral membrane protein